jgi:hypothetical protein
VTIETSFTARIAGLRDAAARARSGTLRPEEATTALIEASALVDVLDLQAFPMSGGDTLEQVVMRVYGIDVSVQGRPDDVFVHIEDQRDDEGRTAQPLTIEVGHTGEIDFTERGARTPEQQDDGE